jgi:hypothetical protein
MDRAVRVEATAVAPSRPHFEDADGLVAWLRASRLTIEEFQRLPFYAWHEDDLAPLVREVTERQSGRLRAA